VHDHTQGPAASVSAGGAAIARVFAGLHDPTKSPTAWCQTERSQVNFLARVLPRLKALRISNGYAVLQADPDASKEGQLEQRGDADPLLDLCKVGYHRACQVTSGYCCLKTGLAEAVPEGQSVDQVFAAAINLAQGLSGRMNRRHPQAETAARLALHAAYTGAYLAARVHGRETLVLTLVGGGVFGNSGEWICDAIAAAHLRYARRPLKRVVLVSHAPMDGLVEALRERKVNVNVELAS